MGEKLSVILGTEKTELKLPDGRLIEIKPITLNDIAKAEDYFGCDLEGFEKALRKTKNILFLIHLSLSKTDANMTADKVGEMFGVGDLTALQDVIQAILKISGLVQKND